LVIGFIEHLQANNFSTFTSSHSLHFTTAHTESSQSAVFCASGLTFTIHPRFWVNRRHIINYYLSEDWNAFVLVGLTYIPGKGTGLGTVAPGIFQDRNVK
jgi:hypothetical protein